MFPMGTTCKRMSSAQPEIKLSNFEEALRAPAAAAVVADKQPPPSEQLGTAKMPPSTPPEMPVPPVRRVHAFPTSSLPRPALADRFIGTDPTTPSANVGTPPATFSALLNCCKMRRTCE
ncbi:unnamed protein product [Gongylonema pulchrum]|uniref:Uncharacterized protein n=1 Tax=Gongylonema pulchrum TaxID=637853 RepID=A0A183DW45_9BILA|nr:unnamed protein product [Gongylonema pulchrum]